ncbi:MAG: molybdopterin-dependent oxidoreductase [Acidimicrobiia bacterium]|nr:molybdopterin-dependent oxidoreductase [Acidimicrobiia bacterium]
MLFALVSAFITGSVVQAVGAPTAGRWLAATHGVIGLAVLVLTPWKSRVISRGLERRNRGRTLSLILAAITLIVIVTGVVHTTGLLSRIGPFTVLWWHIAAALALLPVLGWHVVVRNTLPRPLDATRRNLLRLAGLASTGAVLWWGADRAISLSGLPGTERRFTGSHERSSFDPTGMPVTSWLDDTTPTIDPSSWRLTLSDAAGSRSLALSDLASFPAVEVTADLDCTSGWWSRQIWEGVRLDRLVDAGEARSVVVRSATGYARRYPITDLGRLWLATGVGGESLSPGHGFPVRLIAPHRRGFWWVKWVDRVETSSLPWWVQSPFPLT